MRQLNLTPVFRDDYLTQEQKTAIRKYEKQAESKRIDVSLQLKLMEEIRKGDREAIFKLVDSWEFVIVSVIEQQIRSSPKPSISIEKMFSIGKQGLIRLAEWELGKALTMPATILGSTSRAAFFRFGAWHIKLSILNELND
jgi:hypothetical protein